MQKHFNQYRLSKQIASKPSGSVYLAHRVNHASQKVVLELFETRHFTSNQQNENFLQKAKRIKRLSHPFILPIQDLGIEQGYPYTVRKYLGSDSLHRRLDRLSPQRLSLPEALTIIFQVGQAISYAHQHNVLHGNLKPENIFFNHNDEILLTDFDLANFIDLTKSDIKADMQTVSYLAPEQFVGSTTEKSDQYALGCLAYKLITGRVPFSARDFSSMWAKQSTEPPIPLSDLIPSLPKPIEEAVLKAMTKDPSKRYANVSVFVSALQITSTLATSVVSSPLVAPSSNTLVMTQTRPPESIIKQAPLAKPLHATQLDSDPLVAKSLHTTQPDTPLHFAKSLRTTLSDTDPAVANPPHTTTLSDTDPLVAKSLHEASLTMRLAEHPAHEYNKNKPLMTPPGNPHTEALPNSNTPNQILTIEYTAITSNSSNGYVMLEAATLH